MDTVLYFEGDKMLPYRILRAAKNRYGSTNELGMFDMTGTGLAEIENPSQMLLEGRPLGVSGNCVACTMEGSRPILSEIQALATKTNFPAPRRACSGYDYNRMNLLIAVLEKRAGYFFGNLDVYVNIVGGIALRDTACDLSVCLSMVSSLLDRPVSDKLIAIGEVGLGGEVRSVPNLEQRLHEAERIGFERAVVPKHSLNHLNPADYPGMKLIGAAYISDAINALKTDRLVKRMPCRFIWTKRTPANTSPLRMLRRILWNMYAIWKSSPAKAPIRRSAIFVTCVGSAAL